MLDAAREIRAYPPILTVGVLLATTAGAVAQLVDPAVLGALRRDPEALAAGEWWRIASPLVVLDGNPWLHYAADTVVLVVVGSTLERDVGRLRWALLFAVGALVGQLFGYVWEPTGAGASVGICGLVGGLAIVQLVDRRLHLVASLFSVALVSALASIPVVTSVAGDGVVAGILVVAICSVLINVMMLLRRRSADPQLALSYVVLVVTGGAVVLLASHDNHGAALLAGLATGVALFGRRTGQDRRSVIAPSR